MITPAILDIRTVAPDTEALLAYMPVPGYGVLPVNAFVIRAAEPVLVDTGLASLCTDFMAKLRSVVDPADLRWIWITHTDPDHVGNLEAVMTEAPAARVVTTYLGMGKMGLQQLPLDRVYLLNPGQCLNAGDRHLAAITPPTFDAPETTGLLDIKTRTLFSADCFGALMSEPADTASDIAADALREGCLTWSSVDAPWLPMVDTAELGRALDGIAALEATTVLSAHLPPAPGMTQTLLGYLAEARRTPRFVGPDQTALEQMMAAQEAAA
jgi:hypothetical protein